MTVLLFMNDKQGDVDLAEEELEPDLDGLVAYPRRFETWHRDAFGLREALDTLLEEGLDALGRA